MTVLTARAHSVAFSQGSTLDMLASDCWNSTEENEVSSSDVRVARFLTAHVAHSQQLVSGDHARETVPLHVVDILRVATAAQQHCEEGVPITLVEFQ